MTIDWATGLFEGEGTIAFYERNSVMLALAMTDRDAVDRFAATMGAGTVKTMNRGDFKTLYTWSISRKDEVVRILTAMMPLLCERRLTRATEALTRLEGNRGIGLCTHGQRRTRDCRLCLNAYVRKHRAKVGMKTQ